MAGPARGAAPVSEAGRSLTDTLPVLLNSKTCTLHDPEVCQVRMLMMLICSMGGSWQDHTQHCW